MYVGHVGLLQLSKQDKGWEKEGERGANYREYQQGRLLEITVLLAITTAEEGPMWLKCFVHSTSTMRSARKSRTPFSSFLPCVHCTPVHSAYPHNPVGRVGLLHRGSVSGPLTQEGSALQRYWPGAHGCPAVCGACSSAPELCAAERAGLGLHGKAVDSVKKSLVAHKSVNVYLDKYVHTYVCS